MVIKLTLLNGLNAHNLVGGKMFYVEYEVHGFDGIQKAGPYSQAEVQSQRDDIAGYEGVCNVRVVPAEAKEDE